jgi:hypothetical protein
MTETKNSATSAKATTTASVINPNHHASNHLKKRIHNSTNACTDYCRLLMVRLSSSLMRKIRWILTLPVLRVIVAGSTAVGSEPLTVV